MHSFVCVPFTEICSYINHPFCMSFLKTTGLKESRIKQFERRCVVLLSKALFTQEKSRINYNCISYNPWDMSHIFLFLSFFRVQMALWDPMALQVPKEKE